MNTHRRIPRHDENSPEPTTADAMGATAGRGTEECDVDDCDRAGDRLQVLDAAAAADPEPVREGARCDAHAKDFLEVSS